MSALDWGARGLAAQARLAVTQAATRARIGRILARAALRNPVDLDEGGAGLATITPKAMAAGTSGLTRQFNQANSPLLFGWSGGVATLNTGGYAWGAPSTTLKSGGNFGGYAMKQAFAQRLSWLTDAVSMDLLLSVSSYRVLVDGQYVGKTVRTDGITSGGFNRLNVALTDTNRRLRQIDIELGLGDDLILGSPEATGANTGTLYVGPNDTLAPLDTSNRLTIAVLGDSFSASAGASFNQDGYAPQLGYLLGGVGADVRQIAIGGTGYQVDNGQYTFAQRMNDLSQATFDLVIFAGGINDGIATGEQVAVLATLQAARAVQPNALFVVLGSWCDTSGPSATNLAIEAAIAGAVMQFADANTVFVPVLTDPAGSWITATNGAIFGSGDGTHPGDVGHAYLARRADVAIRSALRRKDV